VRRGEGGWWGLLNKGEGEGEEVSLEPKRMEPRFFSPRE
jgi:hypothetical protein